MLKTLRNAPLGREIALALSLKAALLTVMWYAFFSQPLDKALTPAAVSGAILDHGKAPAGKPPLTQERTR